ncbi:TPA: amidotransferase, partial [Candidatus Sumerlaeota bacterium]|nr:amidotransferase [Candidatus Sumerlaeota bacterium]
MRLHVLQHVPFEDAAEIGTWAQERGHSISHTLLYAGEALPALDAFDMLVVMGGPMNIYEHESYPWLVAEKAFIRESVLAGKYYLGVCLGGQLLADALGGSVTRNAEREIGWHPVTLTEAGRECNLLKKWPDRFTAFHWHGDTFAIPPKAKHLLVSEACVNQAFVYEGRAVGLQFHLEYSQKSIRDMLVHCADELTPGKYVQTPEKIEVGLGQTKQTHA